MARPVMNWSSTPVPSTFALTIAAGLEGARERAYASVREPVEGTMLTVIKDAAQAAREAVLGGETDLLSVAWVARRAAGREPSSALLP